MIPILMYHQVADISRKLDPLGLAVSPAQFERQMSYLARNGYSCLTMPEAVRHFRKDGRAPARSFVLTFDDGYQDVHSKACPILEKFGFTATVFLVAGCMGSPSNWWGQEGARSGQLLSWAEARDLVQRGYILGSHTLSHPFLNLLDDQSAFEEIRNSRVLLQEQLELQVDFFSYPYSQSDARIERLVESAGYTAACAGDSDPWSVFHLWRVPCLGDDMLLSFALKVGGWYDKRTALRESAPGRLLRNNFRKFRRRLGIRHPSLRDVLNQDLDGESKREA
jgi:peptidoglycan/xylan/chitin deacetylase (PgdA/CDA1 family)